jgi:hypothetical protein
MMVFGISKKQPILPTRSMIIIYSGFNHHIYAIIF